MGTNSIKVDEAVNDDTLVQCPKGGQDCPIFHELEALRKQVSQLNQQVRTDSLTSLYNRHHMSETLRHEMERTQRTNIPTSLIILDVDHFKSVNDRYGHNVGDEVLKHIAKVMSGSVRKLDVVCRYGGEEFVIILPSAPLLVGSQVAERVRSEIEQSPVVVGELELSVTVSLGVDCYTQSSDEAPESIIERADKLLYEAKQNGRNQVRSANYSFDDSSSVSQDEKDALFNML